MEPLYVDNTILSSMAKCTTQAMLRHGLSLTTSEEAAALRCGSAWHVAMETWLKSGDEAKAYDAFLLDYSDWGTSNLPTSHRLSWYNVAAILYEWLEAHRTQPSPYTVHEDFVEIGFAYPLLADGSIIYTGRLDAAPTMDGQYYVLDHKTTGSITYERKNKYQYESQMTGYIWALGHQVKGVGGAMIEMVELSKLPSDPKRKCRTHGMVYRDCGPKHATWELFFVERTPAQIDQWHSTAIRLAGLYRKWLNYTGSPIELRDVPRLPVEGTFNNSCEWCEFQHYCTMGKPVDRMREELLYSPWKPWQQQET